MILEIAGSIWSGRTLAWRMFVRNIKGLYRQTVLGLFWAFLPPLANTALWVVLSNGGVTNFAESLGDKYIIYVLAGMVMWQAFIEGLQVPLKSVKSNKHMLSKLRFPRESVLMVGVFETFFNLAVRSLVLIPFMIWCGCGVQFSTLLVPVCAVLLVFLSVGMGCFLMPMGMLYQDVEKFLVVALPLWMLATQIVWPPPFETVSEWAVHPFNWCNPASPLLLYARDLLVLGESMHATTALVYGLVAIPLCVLGLIVFRVSVPVLVERVSS